MINRIKSLFKNNEVKNTGWIIIGKASQMLLSFLVGVWSAQYLGPSYYGQLNYVLAYVTLFTSLCTLGINSSVLINELTKYPEEEGKTLGAAMGMRLLSSVLSAIMIVCIVFIVDDGDPMLIWIAVLSSCGLIFKVFDLIEYWFLKRYLSKITSIASFIGYFATSIYKIYLILSEKNVAFFALSTSVDYIVIAVILFIAYKKNGGARLSFSLKRGKEILSASYHFILSGTMVALYGQTDKVMLKIMHSETEVGYYATASTVSNIWVFVLSAIIASLSPAIVRFKKEGNDTLYRQKNRQLYSIVFYLSLFVSLMITIFAPIIINVIYGEAYHGSIAPLRIITWYVAFSYLGVARDVWLVCEDKQKYSTYIYIIAVVANIALNYLLIPHFGTTGAASASLITQILTSMVLPALWKDTRENVKLMIQGIINFDCFKIIKGR